MSANFKPGDVAMVECSDGEWRRATYLPGTWTVDPQWVFADNGRRWVSKSLARPLAVIDPESGREVWRLHRTLGHLEYDSESDEEAGPIALGVALRKFTDPQPSEPQGLGAVVEDAEGVQYVRLSGDDEAPWTKMPAEKWQVESLEWHEFNAVRVLSEGVF